ncbi:MAG: phosphopantetheine-binding protein [Hafnia alvei]|mgnify:FL=1|jgi:acyl carrier protein|uniref:Acyl carrier protein n=1 Tax=Hafnia alvei TaxID=569 RepID=A0ABD7QBA8_HAFAL|nr:phosphopantetheine-binding protein [Hafnia alvei]ANC39173.1 acyl carrier protein [Hafnia alvei]KAA0264437.1 acyl carrier protein [Hafnia alvei]KID03078.1 acyl carrier protein [Hafnia alvei]TBL38820.1 acyl carrier protein [Hafnia alvei]TBL71003.1 acyl carrier protein [Hafnia alvei]
MSQYDVIYEKVSDMIADAKDLEREDIQADAPLALLSLDSLDYVELIILAKREFGVTLTAELFIQHPNITLREVCEFIDKESVA